MYALFLPIVQSSSLEYCLPAVWHMIGVIFITTRWTAGARTYTRACMHRWVCAHAHARTRTHIPTLARTHTHTHTCTQTHAHACTHTYISAHTYTGKLPAVDPTVLLSLLEPPTIRQGLSSVPPPELVSLLEVGKPAAAAAAAMCAEQCAHIQGGCVGSLLESLLGGRCCCCLVRELRALTNGGSVCTPLLDISQRWVLMQLRLQACAPNVRRVCPATVHHTWGCVQVLAGARIRPGNALLGAVMSELGAGMGQLPGPALASLLWALVVLGVKPTATWLEAHEAACRATLQGVCVCLCLAPEIANAFFLRMPCWRCFAPNKWLSSIADVCVCV